MLNNGSLDIVALHRLPHLVEQIQNIVHAEGGRARGLHAEHSTQQSRVPVTLHEAWQGLSFDQRWDHHLGKLPLDLLHGRVVDIVLETVEIVLDYRYQLFVIDPVEFSAHVFSTRTNTVHGILFCQHDKGQDLVNVGQPEEAGDYDVFPFQALSTMS